MIGFYDYTVVLTYIGFASGIMGMFCATTKHLRLAVFFLALSGLCDMFDGTVASTKQRDMREKKFGIQIDSLSDLICFGALPALFTYHIGGKHYITFLASCFYLLCTLIRLAYFNVLEEERQETETGKRKWYLGLPVTSAALILPLFFEVGGGVPSMAGTIFSALLMIMALAFILPIKIKKPYLVGKIGIIFMGFIEFIALLLGLGLDV